MKKTTFFINMFILITLWSSQALSVLSERENTCRQLPVQCSVESAQSCRASLSYSGRVQAMNIVMDSIESDINFYVRDYVGKGCDYNPGRVELCVQACEASLNLLSFRFQSECGIKCNDAYNAMEVHRTLLLKQRTHPNLEYSEVEERTAE